MKNFLAAILTLAFSISAFASADKKVEEVTNKVEEVKDEAGKRVEEVKDEAGKRVEEVTIMEKKEQTKK